MQKSEIISTALADSRKVDRVTAEAGSDPQMPQKDRRATPRFLAKPENQIYYGERSASIRDLSLEGVFVLDADPLPSGSELTFTLRAGLQDISLEGVVRHSVVDVGMGIQFVNLSAVSKRRLMIHIASLVSAPSQIVEAK